ncbi:DUF2339 domain-containing protein [Sphingomonas sp. R647]|uniref:DUF2339 domain-containing protein n=1 Tax=Sphingomonas sp. R647 TaxID=2875233 RepID=UPI001CD7F125|nr:DUF2339 domain-containing protein [Sphingomonas sp. R647]MCA1198705.1 DUF2339 domain-containing protein [Sphingomonas sp. R647]
MDGILFLAVVALGIIAMAQGQRLRALTRRIEWLESAPRAQPQPTRVTEPAPVAMVAPPPPAITPPVKRVDAPPPPPAPTPEPEPDRPSLESLIGARLPVWIGAVALVVAGFFLVRYAVEIGLLTPAVRTILAALFAIILVGASEAARRIPAVAEDPRIAQALAGAGIASSYATLYIAAALYNLIGPLPAFILMIGVTALGLFLALRHGPPTAVLALAGGFVAPLVAGYDAAGIGPLLAYLGLFTAALFGLAIHRGWGWLALAATVVGFGWVNFLLVALEPTRLTGPAAFVIALALAATLALPRAGITSAWLRTAPLVAGLIQLLIFAPALTFDGFAWSFYLVLAAAALFLAWRDGRHLPGALAALGLSLVLLAAALVAPDHGATFIAAPVLALLFAAPGLALLDRARSWAVIALGSIAGPLLLANLLEPSRLADWQWSILEFIAAALAAFVSWRRRTTIDSNDPGLIGGALAAAILFATAAGQLVAIEWIGAIFALATIGLGLWASYTGDRALLTLPALGIAAILFAAIEPILDYALLIAQSLAGEGVTYPLLPPLAEALRALLPLIATIALLAPDSRQFGRLRNAALGIGIAAALLLLYHLAKLPLAIASDMRFESLGFIERAAITHTLFAAAFVLQTRRPAIAPVLFGLALGRLLWFDLVVLNPVFVAQQVSFFPLALHFALAGFWLYRFLPQPLATRAAIAAALVATLAAVRQAAHGGIITGPIGTGENYGYSAALLLVALAGLTLGIRSGSRDLRLAGLGLLTFVTVKVFLIDAAALDGLLRILSFLGLGIALIGIGWVYRRFLAARPKASVAGA